MADTSRDFVYDCETPPNWFGCCVRHMDSGTQWTFEVSDRDNQSVDFVRFIYWLRDMGASMIGFNNLGFDWLVCDHLIKIFERQGYFLAIDAYTKAQEIISGQKTSRFGTMIWPRDRIVEQIDLLKIHHFDNVNKRTSLKKLEINMRSPFVKDLPFDPHEYLSPEKIKIGIDYMRNDVRETEKFARFSASQIKFRRELAKTQPEIFDVLNKSDTSIGKAFFTNRLERERPGICYTRVNGEKTPRQTKRDVIHLRETISSKVKFQTPAFIEIVNILKNTTVIGEDHPFNGLTARVGGLNYDFGIGGLHASLSDTSVWADKSHDIIDVDVASYYPNLAITNGFYPAHLSDTFVQTYSDLYKMRGDFAKGTPENEMLKLALNGVYGDSGNKYGAFFDRQYMLSITINGQLFLCMLAEMAMATGASVIQANTDGITCVVPKGQREAFMQTCGHWEGHTGLKLEYSDYRSMHIRDVNNYVAQKTDGSMKRIGDYAVVTPMENPGTRELKWEKDHSNVVARKAAIERLINGVDVADTIKSNQDPYDFLLSIKVNRSDRLELWPQDGPRREVQRTSRYYVSTAGDPLVKVMKPLAKKPGVERPIAQQKGWNVKMANDIRDFDWSDVCWIFYIMEAKKLCSWTYG